MFTILICTRNSNRVLSEVINSVLTQSNIDLIDEILIIDYKSTDNTLEIINKQLENSSVRFSIKIIDTPGKSSALISGLNVSKSFYTVILDDDNILENQFIENASTILSNNPNIGCLGSLGLIDSNQTYPEWFDDYKSSFAIGLPQQGKIKDWVWGAASIIKMESWKILSKLEFRFLLDVERLGHNIPVKIGGEDVELSLAIKKIGYEIDFSEELKFIHKFDVTRLDKKYLILNNKGVAASVTIHELYRTFIYCEKLARYGQIIIHFRIIRKIAISLLVLLKNLFFSKSLHFKMSYSTFAGIISGYIYFFQRINTYYRVVEKINPNTSDV